MRIYLVGYMYSGKSTVGRQLARRLSLTAYDLDAMFEHHYHITIPIFFQKYGQEAFRILERQMLQSTEQLTNAVISTGGGTPCFNDNMAWINAHGVSVHLQADLGVILNRAANSKKQRPLLAALDEEQRRDFIIAQLAERMPFYSQSHLTVDAASVDVNSLVSKILELTNDK